MDQNDQDIQNENLVNDDVAAQLAGLQGDGAVPGQQFNPDPNRTNPSSTNQTIPEPTSGHSVNPGQGRMVGRPNTGVQHATDPMQPFAPPAEESDDQAAVATSPPATIDTPVVEEVAETAPVNTPLEESTPEPAPAENDFLNDQEDSDILDKLITDEEPAEAEEKSDDPHTSKLDPALEDIKKHALEELTPLIDKLELSPEKRYDILMEMIQASSDAELIKQAYEAAGQIESEDLKAQALMEIVNEIDYLAKGE